MTQIQSLAAPVGRLLLASIFVMSGLGKIFDYAGTQAYMDSVGLPGAMLPLVIGFEAAAGLAIILGWQTRLAAIALAGFSVVTALVFHANIGDQIQFIMFVKNFAIAGGLLLLVAFGPGAFAFDNRAAANRAAGDAA